MSSISLRNLNIERVVDCISWDSRDLCYGDVKHFEDGYEG